jgi:Holliday junction DNA helicase RuvA
MDDFYGQKEITVYTYLHVREDILQLFGFSTILEKKLFLSLIKVNGVGPKMATLMLGGAPIKKIVDWIEAGDAKALTQLPKVGKRTAEQLILTLRGRLVDATGVPENLDKPRSVRDDVVSALLNLGFKAGDVERAVEEIPENCTLEIGVRTGLQYLSQ